MRVLYLSRADEFRDKSSLVIIAKSVIKHMLAADPEMYVTWVVPRDTKPEVLDEFVLQEMPDPKRLGFLPTLAGLSGRTLGYFMTQDLWYAATQTKVQVPYDVVLSNRGGCERLPLPEPLVVPVHPQSVRIGLRQVDVHRPDVLLVVDDQRQLPYLVPVRVESGRLTVDEDDAAHFHLQAWHSRTRSFLPVFMVSPRPNPRTPAPSQ